MKAVIFDMDGVLIESEPLKHQACQQVLQEYGANFTLEEYTQRIGLSAADFWNSVKELFGLSASIEELNSQWFQAYLPLLEKITLKEGVPELLKELKQKGIKLALATSSDQKQINNVLGKLEENYFQATVSGDELEHSKPDPTIFLKAAEKLGVKPENCLVIEDSRHGVTAAKRAGMKCLAVLTQYTQDMDLSQADYQINSLKEFDFEKFLRGE